MKGTITRLIPAKGFGFIKGEDGTSYFLHASQVVPKEKFDVLREGQTVSFKPQEYERGPRAIDVRAR